MTVLDNDPTTLTREALIGLCHTAIVPQDKWRNRDSASAQKQLGEACALLGAGCEFRVLTKENYPDGYMATDARTIWVEISSHGFSWFEEGDYVDVDTFYIPTPERLADAAGSDWY